MLASNGEKIYILRPLIIISSWISSVGSGLLRVYVFGSIWLFEHTWLLPTPMNRKIHSRCLDVGREGAGWEVEVNSMCACIFMQHPQPSRILFGKLPSYEKKHTSEFHLHIHKVVCTWRPLNSKDKSEHNSHLRWFKRAYCHAASVVMIRFTFISNLQVHAIT